MARRSYSAPSFVDISGKQKKKINSYVKRTDAAEQKSKGVSAGASVPAVPQVQKPSNPIARLGKMFSDGYKAGYGNKDLQPKGSVDDWTSKKKEYNTFTPSNRFLSEKASGAINAGAASFIETASLSLAKIDKKYEETFNTLKKQHPIASGVGAAAGYLVPGIGAAKAANIGLKGTELAQSAMAGSKMARTGLIAAEGALAGGATGGAEAIGKGKPWGGVAKDTALGTVLGAAGDVAVTKIIGVLGKMGKKVTPDVIEAVKQEVAKTNALKVNKSFGSKTLTKKNGLTPAINPVPEFSAPSDIQDIANRVINKTTPASNVGTAKTGNGTKVDFRYEVRSADDLVPSHDTAYNPNKSYPQELQPRDRSKLTARAQVEKIARTLDPEQLGHNVLASDGAPIINANGVVESGNGRTIALKKVYEGGTPKAQEYINWLEANKQQFGIDGPLPKNPVLVRTRTNDVDVPKFVKEANEASTATYSASEYARSDAANLSDEALSFFDPESSGINTASNRAFVSRFIRDNVPIEEQGRMLTPGGELSQEGVSRVKNALFHRAYEDMDLSVKIFESTDNDIKNVSNAMISVAPKVAKIKTFIKSGNLVDNDISADLVAAVRKYSTLKEQGVKVNEYLGQLSVFGQELSDEAVMLLKFIENNARSGKKLTEGLNDVLERVMNGGSPNQLGMFEGAAVDKKSILKAALGTDEVNFNGETPKLNTLALETPQPTPLASPVAKEKTISELMPDLAKEVADEPLPAFNLGRFKPNFLDETAEGLPNTQNKILTKPPKDDSSIKDRIDGLYQSTVAHQLPIEQMAKVMGDNKLKGLTAMSDRVGGTVDHMLGKDLVDMKGNIVDDGFAKILDNIPKADQKAFQDYMYHRHNISRMGLVEKAEANLKDFQASNPHLTGKSMDDLAKDAAIDEDARQYLKLIDEANNAKNKPVFGDDITSDISKLTTDKYLKENPHFLDQAEAIDRFQNTILKKWGVESGLVTEESADALIAKYPNYVPTYRYGKGAGKVGASGGLSPASVIKTAKGSDRFLLPMDQQIAANTNKVVKAARKNELYNVIADAYSKDPEKVGKWVHSIEDYKEEAKADFSAMLDGYDEPLKKEGDFYRVNFKTNGEGRSMLVNESMYKALKAMEESSVDKVADTIKKYATGPFKAVVTQYNPIFVVKNVMRDIPTAFINSTDSARWAKNLPGAIKDIASDSRTWRQYQALGGSRTGIFSYDKGLKNSYGGKVNTAKKALDKLEVINNITEALPRYAEYKATIDRLGDSYESRIIAMYNAGDITTDFSRHGNFTKTADAFVPYLNASVQGIDKTIRQIVKHPMKTAIKGLSAVTATSIILDQVNKKDPAYAELAAYEKNANFHIPMGDGKFVRIPKSREYGAIFATTFEWAARTQRGEKVTFNEVADSFVANFTPVNMADNNMFVPLLKAVEQIKNPGDNIKGYAGIPLVPNYLKNERPGNQYDGQTSEVSKAIGKALDVQPKVLDYLFKSYTGIIGQVLLPSTTRSDLNVPGPLKSAANTAAKAFTTDSVYTNDTISNFYDKLDEMTYAMRDAEKAAGVTEKSKRLTPIVERQEFRKANAAALAISDIRKEMRALENDKAMNDTSKAEKLRQMQKDMIKIAKDGMTGTYVKPPKAGTKKGTTSKEWWQN